MSNRTVLLVDDESLIRSLVQRLLTRIGYEVVLAIDGYNGLKVYQNKQDDIDVVLLDLIMPGISGVSVLQQLKKINSEVKVIVSSGGSNDDLITMAFEHGAYGFLSKPFDLPNLKHELSRVLNA